MVYHQWESCSTVSLGAALEKAVSPNVEWVLGTTSCSSAAEGRDPPTIRDATSVDQLKRMYVTQCFSNSRSYSLLCLFAFYKERTLQISDL